MLDLSKLKSRTVLLRLKEYEGNNEYLHRLRINALNGQVNLTPSQVEYINNNYTTEPIEINKVISITPYFGEQLKEKWELKHVPERILVELLLAESDKAYHIKGKLYKNQKKSELYFLPKTQLNTDLFEDEDIDIEVDFQKYADMDKLGRVAFKHQEEGIKFLLSKKKCVLADDMGLGKSYQSIVAALETGVEKILVVCPANAKINWKREIANFIPEGDINVISGRGWVSNGKFTIINYDVLKNFHTVVDNRKVYKEGEIKTNLIDEGFDLIIMDECFTYETKVKTDVGELCIGDIVENELDVKILSYNLDNQLLEYKKINRWVKKGTKNTLLKIKLPNDIFIECTPNHKIYVKDKGYVKAEEINEGDELYYLSERINEKTTTKEWEILFERMCEQGHHTKKGFRREDKKILGKRKKRKKLRDLWYNFSCSEKFKTKVLFNKLFSKMEDVTERSDRQNKKILTEGEAVENIQRDEQKIPTHSETIFGKDEKGQPNEESRNCGDDEKKINGSNIFKSWWKRKDNETTRDCLRNVRGCGQRLDFGIPNKNKGCKRRFPIFTKSLFTGHRKPKTKDSYRNRWEFTQNKKVEVLRQKENRSLECFRVESVEILERGSGHQQRIGDGGHTKVYNLEVDDNHNYFANGILVSNCHMVKNPTAQRTKILNQVCENIERRWLLTGTPIANRPMDYFNLLFLCGSPLTANWQYFAFRYCDAKKFTKRLKSGKLKQIWLTDGNSNLGELHNRTKKYLLRRMKDDHLDLPPKIVSPYYLEMDDIKSYNSVFEEYVAWAESEGRDLGAGRHMVEMIVLRKFIALKKVEHSVELAQQAIEQGKKVIIFTNFTDSFNALMSSFGSIAVGHNGKMNGTQKQSSIDRFQNDNKVKVFVGNLISAGTAITLTAAEVVIMNDLDFVPSNHAQAEDRAHRIGSTGVTNVYYPIFEDTIDSLMYDMLQKKKQIISKIMGQEHEDVDISKDLIKKILR
jgi:SWI/SNF-related matrix-associated actin-dependent regulator 1 of chromatin subfamily A